MKETRIGFITLALMLAIWASACGDQCNGFGSCIPIGEEPPPEAVLECRTISVDQCFAVQCGYQKELPNVEGGIFEVVANELFCPEDYFDCEVPEATECPATWTCDDFADRVPGHRPIECRP